MAIEDLYTGRCLITFRYPDGSEIQCVSTLNSELLDNLGLDYLDEFVDLLSYKIIPSELFTEVEDITIEKKDKTNLSMLDDYFQNAIKRRWKDV